MELYNELVEYLGKYEFSVDLINGCKDIFQYGGWEDTDFEKFSRLFNEKVKNECPMLNDDKIKQILNIIYERGVLRLEDVLFLDGVAFSNQIDSNKHFRQISYVWESKEYAWCNFFESTHFFSYPELKKFDLSFLQRLRNEISDIFLKYYNISNFPEELGMDFSVGQEYALKADKTKLTDCLLHNNSYSISIICEIKGESTIRKLDITINPSAEKILIVTNVDDDVERLSTIIDKMKRVSSEEPIKLLNKNIAY